MNAAQLMRWLASLVVSGLTVAGEILPHNSTAFAAITGLLGIAGNIGIHAIPSIAQPAGNSQKQVSGSSSSSIQAGGNITQ